MTLVIRDARADERAAVRDLTLDVYSAYAKIMTADAWAALDAAIRRAVDAENAQRIVASEGDVILGSVMLFPPDTAAYGESTDALPNPELRLLAVPESARGKGIGRALVEECIRRARRDGAAALGLHSSKSMEAARELYLRMGFERAPEHDFFPPGAEHVEGYRFRLR